MTTRIDYGRCKRCGKPVVYQGAEFCSPKCNTDSMYRHCPLCQAPVHILSEEQCCEACRARPSQGAPVSEAKRQSPVVAAEPPVLSTARTPELPPEDKRALISDDGQYRYLLARIWEPGKNLVLFVGLNPSTADADKDDPTVNWWRAFAKRLGCGGFLAANLSAFRTSSPKILKQQGFPVGPENDEALLGAARVCATIVVCWGSIKWERVRTVYEMLRPFGPYCLGVNADGSPRHPLARGKNKLRVEDAVLRPWVCP